MWKDVYGKYNIVGNKYFSGMKIIHHISFSAKLETKTVAFSRSWIKFGLLCSRVERKPTESKTFKPSYAHSISKEDLCLITGVGSLFTK